MDMSKVFPSRFLKAADLQGRDCRVVIGQVTMEVVGDEAKAKPILYFQGREKCLGLNVTNRDMIMSMYGPNSDDWIGKSVTLFPTKVEMKGKIVDAIRIRFVQPPPQQPLQQKRKAPEPASLEQSLSEEMNDEIPW